MFYLEHLVHWQKSDYWWLCTYWHFVTCFSVVFVSLLCSFSPLVIWWVSLIVCFYSFPTSFCVFIMFLICDYHVVHICCLFSHVWLFCTPMNCSPPNSYVHGISQARILKCVATSFSRRSSWLVTISVFFFFFFFDSHKAPCGPEWRCFWLFLPSCLP